MNLNELNREQRIAAETLEGPLLVLAGAGSGKTRALTYRVANLIEHGVAPWSIMAITFTNKAASEMRERIASLVGEDAQDVWISTFHAGCARILRRDIEKLGYTRAFTIYDEDDQLTAIKEVLKKQNIDEKYLPVKEIRAKISDAKNKLLSPGEWFDRSPRDYRSQLVLDVYTAYEEKLKSCNALDFDDLLVCTLELLAQHPPVLEAYRSRFRYIHVDEYQDTNYAQYMFVRLLAGQSRNLCVVGDDDQSIYGWRGADVRNILDFEKDFPDAKVIKLEQNYRSSANILDAANQVIAVNEKRKDKVLWTQRGQGERIRLYRAHDERDEAAWVARQIAKRMADGEDASGFAVLYRANALSRVLEEGFVASGIRYRVYGGQRFYDRKEVKDVLAYLRAMVNPADDVSVRRIINVPRRALGDTTVAELVREADTKGIPLLSVCMEPPEHLSARACANVSKFAQMMLKLTMMTYEMGLTEFVERLIETTGLEAQYAREDSEEARSRVENIREFVGAVREFEEKTPGATLSDYLENVALVSDLDTMDENGGAVTLMTLHSAKGLEFDNVFIVGMEENLFPSMRSRDDQARMEEERRLCYVGITRAKKRLFLSYAARRMIYNQMQSNDRSRFIDDIPPRVLMPEEADFSGSRDGRSGRSAWQDGMKPRTTRNRGGSLDSRREGTGSRATGSGLGMGMSERVGLSTVHGVQRGMDGAPHIVRSQATQCEPETASFVAGDRVMHKAFGSGAVVRVSGRDAQARIMIRFDDSRYGVKEFKLSVAPIIKNG